MLLLYPPVAKPSEPPAGIARLAVTLQAHGHQCTPVDLSIEGLLYLLETSPQARDTWSRRALKNVDRNLELIRSGKLFTNISRYRKTVLELNRLLELHGPKTTVVSLANYQDATLSPLQSSDLLKSAEFPESNIFFPFLQGRITWLLDQHKPEYVGISINYLSQALTGFALVGLLRKRAPGVKLILGGGLITSWMRGRQWRDPFAGLIDHCLDGCGEPGLLSLLGSPMKSMAAPRYFSFPLSDYLSPVPIAPYSCSTGCFWNRCRFCPERAEGNRFQPSTHQTTSYDIEQLREEFSPGLLHFLDNAIPPAILQKFAENPLGIPWYGFVRLTPHLLDKDFCADLRRSGCVMLKLGLESGDQNVLDHMEKGTDVNTAATVLRNLFEAGIATYVYLLFGTPWEGEPQARKTMEFTIKHHRQITFLNLAIFNMPINTEESESLQTSGFYEGDLSLYSDFHHPQGWNRKDVRVFLDTTFRKHPAIHPILNRTPTIFTSNHAPFFSKTVFEV